MSREVWQIGDSAGRLPNATGSWQEPDLKVVVMNCRLFTAVIVVLLLPTVRAENFVAHWVFTPPAAVTRWLVTSPIPDDTSRLEAEPTPGSQCNSASHLSWSGAVGENNHSSIRFRNERCEDDNTGTFLRVADNPALTGHANGNGGFTSLHLKATVRLATIGRTQCLIRKTQGASEIGYLLSITRDNAVVFALGDHSACRSLKTSGIGLRKDTWYHIEAIWDGMTAQILIDGELRSRIVDFSGRLTDTSGPLTVGALDRGASTGQFFNGWITEIEVSGIATVPEMEDINMNPDIEKTAWGTPVRKMWFCPPPEWGKPGQGIPLAKGVSHAPVFEPEYENGAYNHHPELTCYHGVFYAMWSNNMVGEDCPGQRILYSTATEISRWAPAELLFPQPGPFAERPGKDGVGKTEAPGFYMTAMKFIPLDGSLYAVAALDCPDKRLTPVVREIGVTGPVGDIFAIQEDIPAFPADQLGFKLIRPDTPLLREKAGRLLQLYLTPQYLPSWNFGIEALFPRPKMVEGYPLCEWSIHQTTDGSFMMLARDLRHSHRMYAGVSDTPDPNSFTPLQPTDIPDTPSKAVTVTLDDGHVLLIGNQLAQEFDRIEKPMHYTRDPLTISISPDGYRFEAQYTLRWEGGRRWRTEAGKVSGRGAGCQYPAAMVLDGVLYVIYSIGKEDIAVSWVPLDRLPL